MTNNALDGLSWIREQIDMLIPAISKPIILSIQERIDEIETALTRQPVNAALAEALKNAENLCKAIVDGYQNTEINHIDFRVKVTKWAEDFLDDDIKAMAAAEAQPAQTVE